LHIAMAEGGGSTQHLDTNENGSLINLSSITMGISVLYNAHCMMLHMDE
jgi:hypothetical protein